MQHYVFSHELKRIEGSRPYCGGANSGMLEASWNLKIESTIRLPTDEFGLDKKQTIENEKIEHLPTWQIGTHRRGFGGEVLGFQPPILLQLVINDASV